MSEAAFEEAMALHQAGRCGEAAARYRAILDRAPDHADSLHLLGLITAEQDDAVAGIALIQRAMAIEPGRAVHYNSLGRAYRRLNRLQDAVRAYRAALALRPDSAEIHSNLATTLRDLGLHAEAVGHYRQAAEHAPGMADIWYNLANALADTGAVAETDVCYRAAIALKPDFVDALGNYGRWLMTQGRWADAEVRLAEALTLAPMQAGVWNNLGVVSRELVRPEAEACFRNAVAIVPGLADAHYNLGCLLSEQGRADEAIACHEAAVAADPGFGSARLGACMAELPILYRSEAEIAVRRRRYGAALARLVAGDGRLVADAIGRSQPFFLPYQGQDDRALQALYGRFACEVLAEPPARLAAAPGDGERIRVGIVSGFFCDHTLWKLFLEGWLTQIDRGRFEVIGFHTGLVSDDVTVRAAGLCDRFVQGLGSGAGWRAAVADAAPHVLLYPEVGMDPVAGRLAAMRLAPVQCVAWGQPETTGLPTIDYFLSSALMEPPEGDAYYTERLVRLPNLGLHYTPDAAESAGTGGANGPRVTAGPGPAAPDFAGFDCGREKPPTGIDWGQSDPDGPVFWSGQALYKYLPRHDSVFPRIARDVGACRFVFIGFARSEAVTRMFRDRLWAAFAEAGLDADRHVVILPPMSQHDYIEAVGRADVILDTIGWSGGKSTLDCLAVNPAIVTMAGRFMRGRHTAAILRHIGCSATIAGSVDAYVAVAVRLARDPVWRAEVRQAVASGKARAFGDLAYVRGLEGFLAGAVTAFQVSPWRTQTSV